MSIRQLKSVAMLFCAAFLPGAMVLGWFATLLAGRIPVRGYPSVVMQPQFVWPTRFYLLSNILWSALLIALLVTLVGWFVKTRRLALAGACLAVVHATLALPTLLGRAQLVEQYRWWILASLVGACLVGPWLVDRLRKLVQGKASAWARALPVAIALFLFLICTLVLWKLTLKGRLYPALVWLALFWVQGAAALLISFACELTPSRLVGGMRLPVLALTLVGVAFGLNDPIWMEDSPRFSKAKQLINRHCGGLRSLTLLGVASEQEWLKVQERLMPEAAKQQALRVNPNLVAAPHKRFHVLLFVIDALRRDHVGAYGAATDGTPNIDRLAAESLLFERSYSPGAGTGISMSSCFTGLMPETLTQLGRVPLWLPEVLALHGWDTATSLTARQIQLKVYPVGRRRSMRDIGFRRHVRLEKERGRSSDEIQLEALLDQLDAAQRPLFYYLHLKGTHGPFRGNEGPERYRQAIRRADALLGRLVQHLQEKNLWDATILAVFGDHGEGLGEHGMYAHSQALYEEQTAVPLVLRVPDGVAARDPNPTTLTRLPALIMQRLGGAWPYAGAVSAEEDPLLVGVAAQEHQIGHRTVWRSLRRGTVSYHRRYMEGLSELYDLANDPGELDDLSDKKPELLAEFSALEQRWLRWEHELAKRIDSGKTLRRDELAAAETPSPGPAESKRAVR